MDGLRNKGPHTKPGYKRTRGTHLFIDSGFLNRRTASTSEPPSIYISNVLVAQVSNKSISAPITLVAKEPKERIVDTHALLDTGAGGIFMDQNFARTQGFTIKELLRPLEAYNIDGTKNKKGTIKHYTDLDLKIGDKTSITRFMITGLGEQKVILGYPWFQKHNPEINWNTGVIQWRTKEQEIKLLQTFSSCLVPSFSSSMIHS